MDDEIIEAIAGSLHERLLACDNAMEQAVVWSVTEALADVVNDFEPRYDTRYFFMDAGYPPPYPLHEMKG